MTTFLDFLNQAKESREPMPVIKQIDMIEDFLKQPIDYMPGDKLKLNKYGREFYNIHPDSIVIVHSILDRPVIEKQSVVNALIVMVPNNATHPVIISVDLHYFKKAKSKNDKS